MKPATAANAPVGRRAVIEAVSRQSERPTDTFKKVCVNCALSDNRGQMPGTIQDIPPLLHDARLSDCWWDRHLNTLHLYFQCLRRNVVGTPLEDSTVELKLGGVEQVTAYYSPASVNVKPSEFEPCSRIAVADLEDWPQKPVEAHLAINSLHAEFELATACVREALVGDLMDRARESPLRVRVSFEPHNYGSQGTSMGLVIDCDSLEPFSNRVPLNIETWERQFEAWWAGWREHWSAKGGGDPGNPTTALEDAFIPAGQSDPPDLTYRPPRAAPFLLPSTTVPAELLRPIEDYHNGHHEQNWLKLAAAYPHFDQRPEERAARLRDQFLSHDYGRWIYVRHIDRWWCDGDRACVVVRGIEHVKGDNDSTATNDETVITYGLRKFRQNWVIATWSQGWPRFGSAAELHEHQIWKDGWNLPQ